MSFSAFGCMSKTENFYLQDNAKEMPKADEKLYFVIDEKNTYNY